MTKILNFALKIKGGGRGGTYEVLRPCHTPQKKFGTCTSDQILAKTGQSGGLLQLFSHRDVPKILEMKNFPQLENC